MNRLRYLTPAEKRRYMRGLERDISGKSGEPVDAEMIPWLSRFNSLDGVCTTQCCAGHPERDLPQGYISLRMTGRMRRAFEAECLGRLSRRGWLHNASTTYTFTKAGYVRPRFVLWFDAERRDEALTDILYEVAALSWDYTQGGKGE